VYAGSASASLPAILVSRASRLPAVPGIPEGEGWLRVGFFAGRFGSDCFSRASSVICVPAVPGVPEGEGWLRVGFSDGHFGSACFFARRFGYLRACGAPGVPEGENRGPAMRAWHWVRRERLKLEKDMDLLFPREFSSAARAQVVAKKILAGRDFEEKKRSVRLVPEIESALRTYILQVFLSFAEDACELGRQGVWGVERVEREAREFLRLVAIEAGGEKGFDRSGRALRSMIGHWGGAILPEVQREFEKSPEWRKFTDELLQVAELQAAGSGSGSVEGVPVRYGLAPAGEAAPALLNVDLIGQWMEAEGYTNIELAEALHLSVRAVTSMRRNGKSHGRRAVQKLADLMRRDALDLYRS
jgi:hypothetical protein